MSHKFAHFLHLALLNVLIVVISTVAIFYSLGYEYNFATHRIQQTGILYLQTDFFNYQADVLIDNTLMATRLPYRYTKVFPDRYDVRIEKSGYQPWVRDVDVKANTVSTFKHILLIKEEPELRLATFDEINELNYSHFTTKDSEIRNHNELWINNTFITRTSEDIHNLSWYPDNGHVVYQTGSTLWLAELDGLNSQRLLAISSPEPVPYLFKNNGRTIVFRDKGEVQVAELY